MGGEVINWNNYLYGPTSLGTESLYKLFLGRPFVLALRAHIMQAELYLSAREWRRAHGNKYILMQTLLL